MRMSEEEGLAFARRPGALPELVRRLKDPANEERAFMATLIGVAGAVAPLMDEDSLVAWRAVEALEVGAKRMCDVAVEEVAAISGREIPLCEGAYTPEAIDEVRRFLQGC